MNRKLLTQFYIQRERSMRTYYIASCVFTSKFPALSFRIQNYIRKRFGFEIVRCCVPKYKLLEFTEKMPEGKPREYWQSLPDSGQFSSGAEVYSLCHNCNNIIEELYPSACVHSLWELLAKDDGFPFPDYQGMKVTVQDCWRSRDRREEQEAVRELLSKMNIDYSEAKDNHERTEYCGPSLYRPQPPRNPKLAPKHYVEGAKGKFIPHTEPEQEQIMINYCRQFTTDKVVCYCHYCLEGLIMGKIEGLHIAQLLFPETTDNG